MTTLRIKQVRSQIKRPAVQKKTLQALGIRKMNQVVEHNATPQILGMVRTVAHLVEVEEVK
jgi:large subunit ribosomal protein L30